MKNNVMSSIRNFFTKKVNRKKEKSTMAMDELIILMNGKHNDFEFGAEARVVIQQFIQNTEKKD